MVTRNLFETDPAALARSWVRIGPVGAPPASIGQPCGRCDAGHVLRTVDATKALCRECGEVYGEQPSLF